MAQDRHRLRGKLEVDTGSGSFLGDTRIRLLEAIAEQGSISQAAKAVPLSYKAAWDAIDAMNNLAEEPLVVRAAGGRHGGGTHLTDYGHRVVALYRALEAENQAALDRLAAGMAAGEAGDLGHFRRLLQRLSMKTSARNQLAGRITGLRLGELDAEVRLQLDDDNELVAVVTRDSAETLGLAVGLDVHALVKSSAVLLFTGTDVKTTARNHLWGEISAIHAGPVNSEVIVTLPSGKTICAVVTHDSVEALGLAPGGRACAVFQASAVILCLYA